MYESYRYNRWISCDCLFMQKSYAYKFMKIIYLPFYTVIGWTGLTMETAISTLTRLFLFQDFTALSLRQ